MPKTVKQLLILAALAAPTSQGSLPPQGSQPAIAVCGQAYQLAQSGFEVRRGSDALFSKAVQSATQCIEQGGGVDGLIIRAEAEYALKKSDAAMADLSDAIRKVPFSAIARFDRGLIFLQIKNYQGAVQDFSAAIELDPNDFELAFRTRVGV